MNIRGPATEFLTSAAVLAAVLGCASLGGVRDDPLEEGLSHPFAADYTEVVRAARAAVLGAGLKVQEDYPLDESTWLILSDKPYSFFGGYGAVVRVVVQKLGENQTVVRVISRRRSAIELGGKGDYSKDIIAALTLWLERPPRQEEDDGQSSDVLAGRGTARNYERSVPTGS